FEGGFIRQTFASDHSALERFNAEKFPGVLFRQRAAFIDDEVVGEAGCIVVRHRWKITEREWIRERSMFLETFLKITPLHVMKPERVASIMAGKDASFGIRIAAKGIAAAFGKHFKPPGLRMIQADKLSHRVQQRIIVQPRRNDVR